LPSRRAVVRRYGGPEVLEPDDAKRRRGAAKCESATVRSRSTTSTSTCAGLAAALFPLPRVPGMEAAGSVVDVGPQAPGVLPG
jgi:NADPH:quinone reductase-like Zn-dependent oxidoreductase